MITYYLIQIYDASINDWRVLDEKTRTDVIEKIVEVPKKIVYIDDYVEIENNTKSLENDENIEYILNKTTKNKNITENIYEEENDTVSINKVTTQQHLDSEIMVNLIFLKDLSISISIIYITDY